MNGSIIVNPFVRLVKGRTLLLVKVHLHETQLLLMQKRGEKELNCARDQNI